MNRRNFLSWLACVPFVGKLFAQEPEAVRFGVGKDYEKTVIFCGVDDPIGLGHAVCRQIRSMLGEARRASGRNHRFIVHLTTRTADILANYSNERNRILKTMAPVINDLEVDRNGLELCRFAGCECRVESGIGKDYIEAVPIQPQPRVMYSYMVGDIDTLGRI